MTCFRQNTKEGHSLTISTSANSLSLSTNSSRSTFGHFVDCLLLDFLLLANILGGLCLLFRFNSLRLVFCRFDRLIPLCFPHFGFHISLRQDGFQRCTLNCTLEFDSPPGSFL